MITLSFYLWAKVKLPVQYISIDTGSCLVLTVLKQANQLSWISLLPLLLTAATVLLYACIYTSISSETGKMYH